VGRAKARPRPEGRPTLGATLVTHTAARLRQLLREAAEPQFHARQQSFSKEKIRSIGVRTPALRRIAREAAREYRGARLRWERIVAVAEALWRGSIHEERLLAIEILARFGSRLDDWPRFDRWVDSLTNWAETDGLSIYLLAPMIGQRPERARRLPAWTRGASRWRRRAAAVALVPLARRGLHLEEAFAVCDRLASDRDDLVEKAVGWLLKEASRTEPRLVTEYLLKNRDQLSRATLRYACEKLPRGLRRRVLG